MSEIKGRVPAPEAGTVGRVSLDVAVYDGKYRVVNDAAGLRALRHGERWRELVGDNLVLQLALEVERLRGVEAGLRAELAAERAKHPAILGWAELAAEEFDELEALKRILSPPEPVL